MFNANVNNKNRRQTFFMINVRERAKLTMSFRLSIVEPFLSLEKIIQISLILNCHLAHIAASM